MRSHSARKWGIILVFVFALTLLSLGIMFSFRDRDTIIQGNFGSSLSFSEQSIPVSFSVSSSYTTPPFYSDDTWSTAFASILEASYRYFGVQTNFISSSQYVRFSPNSIRNAVISSCNATSQGYCADIDNLVAANLPEISTIKSLIPQLALPIDFCQDEECTNSQIAAAGNPVNFEIINYKHAITTNDIKHLLYTEEKPLVLTIKKPYIAFEFTCNNSKMENNADCLKHTDFLYQDSVSYNFNMDAENETFSSNATGLYLAAAEISSAEYFVPKSPAKLVLGEPETFLIYGYNDEHVSTFDFSNDYPFKKSIGGFICKKSNDKYGNHQNYLMGKQPKIQNIKSCMSNSPNFWKPADINFVNSFIKNNTHAQKDSTLSHIYHYSLNDKSDENSIDFVEPNTQLFNSIYLQNATILRCVNSSICNPDLNYSLASFESKPLIVKESNGFTYYYIYKWNESVINKSYSYPELIKLDSISSIEISSVFEPYVDGISTDSSCTYWFIPYDLIDEEMRIAHNSGIHAISIDFEWKKESYARAKEQNYEKILRSTFTC